MRNPCGSASTPQARRLQAYLAVLGLLAAVAAAAQGQAPADAAAELDRKLIAEARAGSQLMANLKYLCDEIGPRLTGSPALKRANQWAAERMKASGKLLSRLAPQDVGQLARRHELLQGLLKTNLMVLATAHAVSEGIMRRLSGDLARKACPQGYGASGRATAPDPKRAQPLALSRTL